MIRTHDKTKVRSLSGVIEPGALVTDSDTRTGQGLVIGVVGHQVTVTWSILPQKVPTFSSLPDELRNRVERGKFEGWSVQDAEVARNTGLIESFSISYAADGRHEVVIEPRDKRDYEFISGYGDGSPWGPIVKRHARR